MISLTRYRSVGSMGWKVVSSPFIPIVTERAISVLLNHLSLFTSSKKSKVSVGLAPEGKVCQGGIWFLIHSKAFGWEQKIHTSE